jgi:Uma2 family endonuclease
MCAEHSYVPSMTAPLMTAEELLHASVPNKRTELVRGRLIVHEPPGGRHGYVAANLAFRLHEQVERTGAGAVFVGDVGFTLQRDPDTVRGPDVAFVRRDRLPPGPIPSTYLEFAPDLVVEVLSPNDRPGEVLAKIGDWLDAGARLVWAIDPERRLARVYRADGTERILEETSELLGEDVLPGFRCTLASILG